MEDQTLKLAKAQSENIDNWLKIRLAEVTSLANTGIVRSMDLEQIKPGLVYHHERLKEYYELLYIATPDGTCYLSTGEVNDISDREYFKQAMAGKTLVSDPVISKATGNPIVVAISPVKDDQGKVIGAFAGVVLIDTLNRMVSDIKIGETGYAYMVQRDGLTLVHPDKDFILKKNFLEDPDIGQDLRIILTKLANGETGYGYYDWYGEKKLISYAPVETTGWGLAVTVPVKEINKDVSALANLILIIGIVCLLILGIAIFFILQTMFKPVQELTQVSKVIAGGDLTQDIKVKTTDEIGQLGQNFNEMVAGLRGLVQQISNTTSMVADVTDQMVTAADESGKAAEQVATSMGELAAGSANEAEVTQQTAEVANQMDQALKQVEISSEQIDVVSKNFKNVVDDGMNAVNELSNKTNESIRSSQGVETAIRDLDQKSKEIGQIVEVITNIADQTNLLALNAAIEAARAGEQGRGFAVVAEEVRKLAEGSGKAANQIDQIIRDIQKGTEHTVNEVATAISVIQAQAEVVETTEKLFGNIEKGIDDIQHEVNNNKVALNQLSTQVQKIVDACQNISSITQQSASSVEEVSAITEEQTASAQTIASSAQEIARLVRELEKAVGKFKLQNS